MDIHRCRFVPYQPQTINALAFSRSSDTKQTTPKDLRLAIGRANGDIELWNPCRGQWSQERVFRGAEGRTIEQLHWTQDLSAADGDENHNAQSLRGQLRLFSSGGTTSITEWDISKGIPIANAEGNSADIWCFAPQPQWTDTQLRTDNERARNAPAQLIAAGCADGSIVLFSTSDDELRFLRFLIRPQANKKSRCISITWRDRNTVIAGFEESIIRVITVDSRRIIRTLTLGKAIDAAKPLVWAVKCLPNGTILSGDSAGELKIWDAQNYSLVQRLKTHQADILDITTNAAGTMILTCGVDRRTVAYAPQSGSGNARTQRWYEIRHRRFHEHDVKAITSFESRNLSIAVSGGIDTVPVVLPLKNWNEEYHRSLSHLPQKPQMSVSSSARLLLTWWDRELFVWQLPPGYDKTSESLAGQSEHQLLAKIQLQNAEHITSADIADDGTMVVAATTKEVKLFQIKQVHSVSSDTHIRTRSIEMPPSVATQGAGIVKFSPNSKWLCIVRLNSVVSLVKIVSLGLPHERPIVYGRIVKLDRKVRLQQQGLVDPLGNFTRQIVAIEFAGNSRILAVGDLSGCVDTWILEGHELESLDSQADRESLRNETDTSDSESDSDDETDSRVIHGQRWIRTPAGSQLPSLESAVTALAFRPSSASAENPPHVHGNEGLHATRHNHHPVAQEHPSVETGYLFVVTADRQVVEFDTIRCRLSDWSRRRPSSELPQQYKNVKDQIMSCWVTHRTSTQNERLWLYGSTCIFMFDLRKDFKTPKEPNLVKIGKIGQHTVEVDKRHTLGSSRNRKRKRAAGAGDMMRQEQRYSSLVLEQSGKSDDMQKALPSPPGSDSDQSDNEDNAMADEDYATGNEIPINADRDERGKENGPSWWHTFQYRGIFGACHLSSTDPTSGREEDVALPEVVIVERPMYDVELVPRFSGSQEW